MSEHQRNGSDELGRYLELRTDYLEELREHDLVDSRGLIRSEVIEALYDGGRRIPIEGSSLDRHCQEHPEDPICTVASTGGMVEEFLDVRARFLEEVTEAGLQDVQRFVHEVTGAASDGRPEPMPWDISNVAARNAGLVTPEQGLGGIPPGLRPYVTPTRSFSDGSPTPMPLEVWGAGTGSVAGDVGSVGLVTPDQGLGGIPPWLWPYVNPGSLTGSVRFPIRNNVLLY